jgi:hypothetical protein
LTNINGGEIKITNPDDEILEAKWIDLKTANDIFARKVENSF